MFYFGPNHLTKEYFMQQLVESPPPVVAVDCETISLEERMPVGFSIATTPDESFYFQTFPEPDPALHYLTKVLTDPSIKKVFHNAPFDLRNMPLVVPIEMSNIADTAVMARLLGAQDATLYLLAIEVNKETTPAKEILSKYSTKSMLDVPLDVVAKHCADDSRCTLALYHHYSPHINPTYFAPEMEVIPILLEMGLRGVAFNESNRAEIEVKLENDLVYYGNMIKSLGVDNPGSNQQVGFILAKRGNFLPLTKSRKQLKVDEDTLEFIDDPLAQIVLSYRYASKILSTYIRPLAGQDRAYTQYGLDTVVGRTTSSKMNLQNVPGKYTTRQRVEYYNIRDIFMPDNGMFTSGDYARLHMYILMHLCLHPDTRVLKADLTWGKISNIRVGDKLIGIDEKPQSTFSYSTPDRYGERIGRGRKGWKKGTFLGKRKLRLSTVLNTSTLLDTAYHIEFTNGVKVIASKNHPWLRVNRPATWASQIKVDWIKTDSLVPGTQIKYLGPAWETENTWESGYLAGLLDGEGSISGKGTVNFAQNPGNVMDDFVSMMRAREFSVHNSRSTQSTVHGLYNMLRLLGTIRPRRLLNASEKLWNGIEPKVGSATVLSVRPIPEPIELINIETSTGTFIAEGLFTHNSGDKQMERILVDGDYNYDIHQFFADKIPAPRKLGKTINLAIPYGATAATIMAKTKINDIRRCSSLLDFWFKTFPDAAEWLKAAHREGLRDGWSLPTLFGRRIKLPEDEREDELKNKAVNYPVLGTDGEIIKRALIICKKHSLPLAITVHDNITLDGDCEFPVEELEHIAPVRIPFEVTKTLRWE